MIPLVEKELDRLVAEGIIKLIQFADKVVHIIPGVKQDKVSVRICGDFKFTVNQAPKLDHHPIPIIEDLFAKLKTYLQNWWVTNYSHIFI